MNSLKINLWNAINNYVEACNGKTDAIYTSNRRMDAVVKVEQSLKEYCGTDGPVFNSGRSEGWTDICAELRQILDPIDHNYWNKDGLLKEIIRLKRNECHQGYHGSCEACNIEAEIGTEEVPHPIDERIHTCNKVENSLLFCPDCDGRGYFEEDFSNENGNYRDTRKCDFCDGTGRCLLSET
jgi:hypothetical protein